MHFSKAIIILAGGAAAVPLGVTTSSTSTGAGVSSDGKSVSASVPLVGTVCLDLFGGCSGSSSSSSKSTTGTTGTTGTSGSTGSTAAQASKAATAGSTTGTTGTSGTSGTSGSVAAQASVKAATGSTGTTGTSGTSGTSGSTAAQASKAATGSTGTTGTSGTSGSTAAQASKAAVASSVPATSGSTSSSSTKFSTTQSGGIYADLVALDGTLNNAIAALAAFTSDDSTTAKKTLLDTEATAVGTAGSAWQAATVKLLTDAQALVGKGVFSADDSTKIASYINSHIATDLQSLYQAIIAKKTQFGMENMKQNVHDGLSGIRDEIEQICNVLTPMISSNDYSYLRSAGNTIYNAAQTAINTFAS